MDKNPITERFLYFLNWLIENKKVKDSKDFTKKIEVSPSSITEIRKNRTQVGGKLIHNSVSIFGLNANWLSSGVGEMIIGNTKTITEINEVQINTNQEKESDMTETLNLYRENYQLLKEKNANNLKRIAELENELLMYKGKFGTDD